MTLLNKIPEYGDRAQLKEPVKPWLLYPISVGAMKTGKFGGAPTWCKEFDISENKLRNLMRHDARIRPWLLRHGRNGIVAHEDEMNSLMFRYGIEKRSHKPSHS